MRADSGQRESNPHFVPPLGSRSALGEQKTVIYNQKLRHTCVKICVTFSRFPRSGQFNGLSRARCSCEIALLVRRLFCRLPGQSAAMGSQIDQKAETLRSQGNLGRLAKDCRPGRRREPGPSKDPINRSEDRRAGHRGADSLSNRRGMA
jgi:hypothetical protein